MEMRWANLGWFTCSVTCSQNDLVSYWGFRNLTVSFQSKVNGKQLIAKHNVILIRFINHDQHVKSMGESRFFMGWGHLRFHLNNIDYQCNWIVMFYRTDMLFHDAVVFLMDCRWMGGGGWRRIVLGGRGGCNRWNLNTKMWFDNSSCIIKVVQHYNTHHLTPKSGLYIDFDFLSIVNPWGLGGKILIGRKRR